MGATLSNIFGVSNEYSDEYLQLSDLGSFLSRYIFIMLDKEKRKLVSKQEYLTLVNQFREQKTTEAELDNFLRKHQEPGKSTDYIDEKLFRKLIIQLAIDFDRNIEERMKYLMTLFDKDEDGFVNESDLLQVYDTIGITVPKDPIRCLIQKYDVDGDGKLNAAEFEQLGRSAMNKLFIRREETQPTPEDLLVAEAIQRARSSSDLTAEAEAEQDQAEASSPEPAEGSNNNEQDKGFVIIDDVVFGSPVVLSSSALGEGEIASASCLNEQTFSLDIQGNVELTDEIGNCVEEVLEQVVEQVSL